MSTIPAASSIPLKNKPIPKTVCTFETDAKANGRKLTDDAAKANGNKR
jgi:hypothetical protein